jgi:rod shape-determining protein MreC
MAAFGTGGSRAQVRGPSPGFRFTLYAILSIVVMFLDQRHGWLEQARFVLQAAAYPIQLAVGSPSAAWHWLHESFETRDALRAENQRLQGQQRELELRSMRYEALARENGELRGLRDALPPVAERYLAAEIVNIQLNSLRQRVLINRGATNGVFKAQAVLDDKGLIGQTTHVGPWSAEVILITDPEHAVPVEIERTGLRTIAVGAGDTTALALPYLPGNADIKTGDLLVTSGLGGVFPAGYPVARVTEVHRDAVQPLAQVRAIPFARIDTDTEVVLVWFRPEHPAAPASGTTGDLKVGNAALQPQSAPPPRPKPTAPDATTAPAPTSAAPGPAPNVGRPAAADRPNSTTPAPSKKGTPAPTATPPLPTNSEGPAAPPPTNAKEPPAGDAAPAAAPKRPTSPAPAPPDATPRNP